jgi:hypothetical protein
MTWTMRPTSRATLAAICAVALAVGCTGCLKTVDGTAAAAESPNRAAATTTADPAPRVLPVTVLETLLLTADQLITLVGETSLALVSTAISTSKIIDDRTCLGLGSVGDVAMPGIFCGTSDMTGRDTGGLRGNGSRIEVSMHQHEDARWGCSHALAVHDDVVAEARVCLLGGDTAPTVNTLLDQIVARIPQ